MKFKFVKKGTDLSSEQVSQLMNFEQMAGKAAGLGSAPLAKGALASKSAVVTKAMLVAAVPFSAAVYVGVTEFVISPEVSPDEEVTEIVMEEEETPLAEDTVAIANIGGQLQVKNTPTQAASAAKDDTKDEEETEEAEEVDDEILVKEDIMIKAEPVNGFPAFYETIDRELTYPEDARISGTEGFVRIYFVVDKDGNAGKFRVVQSLGNHFDDEALRVMKKLTEWKPAMHNGQAVSSHLSIKLRFELTDEN